MQVIEEGGAGNFRVTCEYCQCKFNYTQRDLGYRAWYPHGFVYCPHCKKPLRHKLEYRINPDGKTAMEGSVYTASSENRPADTIVWTCTCGWKCIGNYCIECGRKREEAVKEWYCTECGKKNTGAFCSECGKKRG